MTFGQAPNLFHAIYKINKIMYMEMKWNVHGNYYIISDRRVDSDWGGEWFPLFVNAFHQGSFYGKGEGKKMAYDS